MAISIETRLIPAEIDDSQRDAARLLNFDGAENFRDLGGYSTGDGRRVRWGKIYRSGHLAKITDEDRAFLLRLGISKVNDFRGPMEKADKPDRLAPGIEYAAYPIDVAGVDLKEQVRAAMKGDSVLDAPAYLTTVNRSFATEYAAVYGEWLRDMARDAPWRAQVFHCTAGKDRAGFASAVLLRVLGVAETDIYEDYLLTNICTVKVVEKIMDRVRKQSSGFAVGEQIRPLLMVDRRYLQTAFDTIDRKWGGFQAFVKNALGLSTQEVEVLKDTLLE